MQREVPLFSFDRPDEHDIEIIRNPQGVIVHAKKNDHSVLGYLLRIGQADHGHEAAATRYLDWQLAYNSTRGFKINTYGAHQCSGGNDDAASHYLTLIRRLGFQNHKLVEFIVAEFMTVSGAYVFARRHDFVSALDTLGRKTKEVMDESGEDKIVLAPAPDPR